MMTRRFAIVATLFAAVSLLVGVADAGWTENWDSYVDDVPGNGGAPPAGDWIVATPDTPPGIDNRLSLSAPNALDGNANDAAHGIVFRAVDPGDNALKYSWSRLQGNSMDRTLEIGMFTSADITSPRVTMFLDLQQNATHGDPGPETFNALPDGGSFNTGITGPDNDQGPAVWYDAIIQLLPNGTEARVGWRTNSVGGPYTESVIDLPTGFEFNYVGIDKLGRGGPAGPNARVDNIEVTFIPEPTSVALMCLAVLGMFGFDRRRRR